MNKPISNDPGGGVISLTAPDDFELDEIEWDNYKDPIHLHSIPFKNTVKQILKELERE